MMLFKVTLTNNTVTLFTFSTLQLRTHSVGEVRRGVAPEAASGARAEPAAGRAGLAAPSLGVVEGLRAGVHAQAFVQVAPHAELIWEGRE